MSKNNNLSYITLPFSLKPLIFNIYKCQRLLYRYCWVGTFITYIPLNTILHINNFDDHQYISVILSIFVVELMDPPILFSPLTPLQKAGHWPAWLYFTHPILTQADGNGWSRGWPSPHRWPTSATPLVAPPASAARPIPDGFGPAPDNGSPLGGM